MHRSYTEDCYWGLKTGEWERMKNMIMSWHMSSIVIVLFGILQTTTSLPHSREQKITYDQVNESNSGILFAHEPDANLYWQALTCVASNNQEAALKIVETITSHSSMANQVISQVVSKEVDNSLDTLFDKLFIKHISSNPYLLTQLGLFESIGIRRHNAYLNDISPVAVMQDIQNKKLYLHALEQHSPDTLQDTLMDDRKITYKIVHQWLKNLVASEKFLFHEYKINQMFGVLFDLSALFTQYHILEIPEDIEHYITRLAKIPVFLSQTIQFLEHQKHNGIKYPAFALEKTANIIKQLIPENISENIFYSHLAKQINKIKEIDRSTLLAQAKTIIQTKVYPAYQSLLEYCKNMSNQTNTNHGVWALPDGDEYYSCMLKLNTTTNLSADEIHALGLKEVQKIQDEMRAILTIEDIAHANKPIGELMNELAQDPRFYFPDTEDGRQKCLARYYAILERSRTELSPLFDLKPKSSVLIKPVPKHEEEGAPAAYYLGPNINGSRPGTFFANLRNMNEVPTYGMETLLIHEAEPGHHFQIALQLETTMHILRKMIVMSDTNCVAYSEGWALYVEKLAYEQGFYSSSFDCLGHLSDELLRAARLVVDTGIHKKRWTREQAIDYMVQTTGFHRDSMITEVERYFVLPGQACAYKIGQLKILELRKRAQEALGKKFDIREFHNTVLTLGAAPLTILEEVVDQYIQNKLK